jgi:shikimate kinase
MENIDNITLIGMPGAGKSTLGVVLAKMLGFSFIDCDILIQEQAGKTLRALIEEMGPENFLDLEASVISGIDCHRTVISTGGSAIYRDEAMRHLKMLGRILYLEVELGELEHRLGSMVARGIVMRDGSMMGLGAIYTERVPLYERWADLIYCVNGQGVRESAEGIIRMLDEGESL